MSDYGRNVANDDQVREWAKALRAERSLADALANLAELVTAADMQNDADVRYLRAQAERLLARWREARKL